MPLRVMSWAVEESVEEVVHEQSSLFHPPLTYLRAIVSYQIILLTILFAWGILRLLFKGGMEGTMEDLENLKKFPMYIEVKPGWGYRRYGLTCHILSKIGRLCEDMYSDYEPNRFRVELFRRNKLKVHMFFKSQADKEAFEINDSFHDLLAEIKRYSQPRKFLITT